MSERLLPASAVIARQLYMPHALTITQTLQDSRFPLPQAYPNEKVQVSERLVRRVLSLPERPAMVLMQVWGRRGVKRVWGRGDPLCLQEHIHCTWGTHTQISMLLPLLVP